MPYTVTPTHIPDMLILEPKVFVMLGVSLLKEDWLALA